MTVALDGLGPLAARFDHFLVDQFGVLLDGAAAYPFAPSALKRLADMGKSIVLISNSGRRAAANAARLARLGFAQGAFRQVVTSGEVAHRRMAQALRNGALAPGARVLVLAREGDTGGLDGLDLAPTDAADEAALVLIAGSEAERLRLEDYVARLAPAAARRVPAICANPDRVMLTPLGPRFGAGVIAEAYARMGGPVQWIGKPWPEIYRAALEALGDPEPAGVLAIGDSPAHDVAGGRGAGLATALVQSGIHAGLSRQALLALCRAEDAAPDFILPRFAF